MVNRKKTEGAPHFDYIKELGKALISACMQEVGNVLGGACTAKSGEAFGKALDGAEAIMKRWEKYGDCTREQEAVEELKSSIQVMRRIFEGMRRIAAEDLEAAKLQIEFVVKGMENELARNRGG